MIILGVTGGTATGKSVVTQFFADLGAPTMSADVLARDLLAPGTSTSRAVLDAFPDAADTNSLNSIDRARLGRLVFSDAEARRRLETVTHPAIIGTLRSQFDVWRALSFPRVGVGEIPLLFEANLEALVDKIVVVACDEKTQLARLMRRDGLTEDDARRRLSAQWPLSEKVARADFVIDNDGDLEDVRRQVAVLWESLQV